MIVINKVHVINLVDVIVSKDLKVVIVLYEHVHLVQHGAIRQ